MIADVNASGTMVRSYTYGPGIDNIWAMTVHGATTQTYYFLKDHAGSVVALTDESGAVVESYVYDAWGRVTAYNAAGQPLNESAIGNRYTFQGREYSWRTGLYYFRARWYDPVTGRWLSKDPIGLRGGLNLYAYCANNPINVIDPYGLAAWGVVGGVNVDLGLYYGGAFQASGGIGFFARDWGSTPNNTVSPGVMGSIGGLLVTPWGNKGFPASNKECDEGHGVFGAFAGIGGGFFLTSLDRAEQAASLQHTLTFNTPAFGLTLAYSEGGDDWYLDLTFGPGGLASSAVMDKATGGRSFFRQNK